MEPSSYSLPLLFLDIDGVMNTTGSCLRHRSGEVFAAEAVMSLRWLVQWTGARIVVTSTRRRAGLAAVRDLFRRNGLNDVAERIIGLTPVLTESDTDDMREEEILQWLEAKHVSAEACVVLDDKPLTGSLARRLVRTDPDHGLTWELARLAAFSITS